MEEDNLPNLLVALEKLDLIKQLHPEYSGMYIEGKSLICNHCQLPMGNYNRNQLQTIRLHMEEAHVPGGSSYLEDQMTPSQGLPPERNDNFETYIKESSSFTLGSKQKKPACARRIQF